MEQFERDHKLMLLDNEKLQDMLENQKKLTKAAAKYEEARLKFEAQRSIWESEKQRFKEEEALIKAVYAKKRAEIVLTFDREHGFSQNT